MATRETQQRIIEAAIELFNREGTAAVSTNGIAAACGISKGNLHYHFRSKQAIIQSIFQQMVDEVSVGWRGDYLQPTLRHMAEMFTRQSLLVYDYRFFYREMPNLLRSDALLLRRYQENRRRRTADLEQFFLELDRRGALDLNGDRSLIRSLIHSTWIIADYWLNSIEFLGREITEDDIMSGYELILDIFRPYFVVDEGRVMRESYAAICQHTRLHAVPSTERARRTRSSRAPEIQQVLGRPP